jgi:succinyl-CoA synthetase beta subunit
MNLHEYQAKELLQQFDLPLLKGKAYINHLDTIEKDLNDLSGPPWVVKSQIHAGGRGAGHFKKSFNNKGGVQIIQDKTQVPVIAKLMLGNILITKQTGADGKKVNRLFTEEGCKIEREFYLSLLIDRNNSQLMLMISSAGGMNIEDVAEKNPEKIYTTHFPDLSEINLPKNLQQHLEINSYQFEELLSISRKLIRAFKFLDASTIEINPLVLNSKGNFVLLDAKLILDDNALFRHPKLEKLKDITEENPLEYEASQNNMNYVKLDGSIGCMVNGAGLAMATMDIIKQFGEKPANFLDLGGTANKERTIKGFKIIQSDPNVRSVLINIFGGIIRCDMIASGIVEAIKELDFKLPIVVRFQGTNAAQGRDTINQSSSNVTSIDDLTEAANKVVQLAK